MKSFAELLIPSEEVRKPGVLETGVRKPGVPQ